MQKKKKKKSGLGAEGKETEFAILKSDSSYTHTHTQNHSDQAGVTSVCGRQPETMGKMCGWWCVPCDPE